MESIKLSDLPPDRDNLITDNSKNA